MAKLPSAPIQSPPEPSSVSADAVAFGKLVPAIDLLKIFSDTQWEEFVLEWADSLKNEYVRVERCGGAGDMGRDVIAMVDPDTDTWDNFQCKHHGAPLAPHDIWTELGKLVFYTRRGDYGYPRRYSFVAPRGAGTKLSNLLKKPDQLRAGLIDNWDTHCRTRIAETEAIELDEALRGYIETLDFSIFDAVPPLRILDGHAKTRWHVARFGGGLPERPPTPVPPSEPAAHETVFVQELFRAYGDHLKKPIAILTDLDSGDLHAHYGEARLEFYSAESLRTFSRDTLPPGAFERLQDDVHSGIGDDLRDDRHADGYRRVVAVVKTARLLPLDAHAVHGRMSIRDRGGICHQLVNDRKIRWVK